MSAFKLSNIWQEDIAINLSKLFSSNKSVEDNPTKTTSETVSLKDKQTAVTPKDGKINEQAFSGSANKLVTDLTKVFQGSVDKETSSAQEEPTDSEAIGLFPTIGLNQPEEGLRQKLGSFFSRTSKSKPKQSLTPPQSESVTSLDLNTEYRNGTPVPKQNDAAEKEPLRKHIAAGLGSNAGENGNRTLMVTCLETPSTEQIFDQSGLVEQNKSEVANHKGIKINSTTSAQYMGSGQSEEKCNGSAQTTDPTAPQKLRQISSSIPLQKDDNSSAYQRSLTKPQTVVDKCKEINSQVLEDGVNERDNVENENKMSVPRTITYSTYCGARRIRRRRTQKKPFQPLKPTISEVDERNLTSLDDQKEEETKQCVLLPAPEMTEIQTPLEEKIPLIMANESITMNRSNHGKGNDELQPRISIEKNSSNKHELTKDEKLENEAPMQQSSFSEIIKDMELTDLHQEITKIITDYNIVTIDHIKKQAIQSDTPVSNTTSRQKMTGVNPNDISAPSVPVAPEDFYSKGSSVPKMDTKYLAQKNSLIVDHNDLSHKNEDFIDTETATQTDSSPKTAVIVNPQQKAYIPSVSKSKNTNENKSNVPWAHGLTVDEVGASATQNFKPVNLNTLTSLENQKADNTDTQGKNIASNSAEDVALGLPLSIVFNQDDIEEQKTGPVSKGEKQAQMVDISDNVTADPTIVVSLTEPVKTIHLSKNVDTQKELRNDKNDVQLEIPSGTQIIEHTTVSETVTMFDDKRSIPDVCTNDMPEEQKGKDNITRLSTGSLTIETGYEIEKSPKKYNHAMQRSAATALTHVNEETPSEVPNRQINQNSTVLTTIEMINEARTEDTATSTNESTAINENDEVSKMPRIIDSTIAPVTASITIQLNGISNSEATITTEHEEIADSSYPQTEKSLHIQKPDQMYKTYSVNEHGHTSEVLQGTQDPFHEPKLPSTTRPSLLSESIFYRFYQESMELLDSAINTNSTSNNETVTMPVVKENQLIEEIHDNTETSNFVTMQQDANESSIETSRKCSPSENSLWYRCFQQSSGLLNTESNIQPNIISETNFENAWNNEMIQLTKPSTRIANFAEEVIQGTLEGDVLNNSRMTSCHEKDEEMAKKIAIHDKENSNSTNSDKPEDKEILLKITENKEGNISLQSGAEQMKVMCAIDATQALPAERVLTADNGDTLEGKAEEVKEKLVSSAVEMIPHTQLANITNKMGIINRKMAPDFIQNTGLMNSMKDIDLNECMNELTMNKMIEDEPEELKKILQIKDERRKVVVDSDLSAESENSSVQIPGEESKDSFLFTHENISEYVPLIHRPDEKNASIMVEPHEKNISTASLLPTDTDPTLVRSVKNNINQVAGTGHLNLTPTGYETGITESTVKTIEIDVNDCQVKEPEPAKETGQGTELRNTVDATKDSLSKAYLEIITTDNENSEPMSQEPPRVAAEQCNVPDGIQSAGILKTRSATSSQSNVSQESSIYDFKEIVTNPEAANFQPDSVPSKVSQYSFSVGQVDSMNQNTTLKEDGSDTLSEMQSSCKNSVSDSIKPLNGTPKRKIQKIQLSPEEAFKNIQVPDAVQLPQTDSGAACKSDMTVPSETKPVVDSESFTEPVTPYTQPGSIASKENIITAETGQDFTDNTRLMDKAKGIDLNESTINFTMNNSIHQEAEKLKKTLHVKDERLKVLVDSEVSEVSEGDSVQIPRGGNKDSPLFTHENISEYVPSIHRADEKNASHVESHEKSISTASLLPTNTDLTLVRSVKDNITQVTGTGHLNLTPTGYETGITESTVKTIEINVNNCQVKIPDPTKETGQGTEIRNTMDAAKDFLSKTPLEVIRTDNEHFEPMAQEPSAGKIDQCDIADPLQSVAAVFKAKSVTKSVSNGVQEHLMSDYEKSKSGQLANPSYFINTSLKTVEEDDTRISGLQTTVDDVFADIRNSQVTKGIELIDYHLNNEKEMVPEFLEQEALILDQSLGCSFRSQKYFPFGLPPIYEEQELENEAIMDVYSIAHSPTSITQHSSNHPVTSLAEPTAVSVPFVQTQVIVEDAEKEEQNPTSPAPAVDVSTSLSNDNLNKPTAISQEISGKQNLSSQLQTDTCEVDSKISHNPGSSAGDSVFYRYFQSSKNYLPNAKEASLPSTSKILTDLQHKPIEDSKLLKCSSDSKGLVGNKSLKINPRPGKVVIYDQLNFHGNKREIFTDVPDATSWIFSEGISLIVVRGCWILYEKPEFQGQTYILEEGHRELDELWVDKNLQMKPTTIKNVIGSIKRIVKNHCIPEIAIFQEPQQNEIKMYLHSEVTCLEEFGIPSTVSSLIVNSGIWLAYYKANFGGHCTLLEAGNSSAPPSTELTLNNIKSLRPLEMGGLKVERPMAPKVIIFEKTFFNGHSKEICKDTSNLKSLWEDVPDLNINDINGVGSVRVLGGVWVCYEKECYSGHQYLLEEGEYADWQAWGGFDSTVQSMRYIQADYMKPEITLFVEADLKGEKTVFVNHDIPNLEIVGHGTVTQSIEVKNGVWVVYHEEHYCGKQYILEKGVYRNYTDWGGNDGSIMSIRPIQLELVGGNEVQFQLQAFNRVDFQGESVEFVTEIPSLPSSQLNSFKVLRGCWVLYDGKDYSGHQYVLEEGHYPDLDSLGCLSTKPIQSLKPIRYDFSMPSISLFSVCSFEGQELILTEGINCWKDKGYYQMPKSVKVNSGIWIAYEHANFRGRQFLLESTEITNWNEFSEGRTIGSIRLLEQPRVYFQIKNKATGGFLTVDGDAKDPKGSKLSVCPYNGKTTQMWFYCNGLIQSKANYTCIDTIGSQGKAGTRVILWTEHSRTHQKWNINRDGTISSFLDFNLRLDIKGGYSYDKHHIILNSPEEEQQTQFWDIEVMR
ncbi:hypothetical protein chiPu_0007283 [Chiloscyllium punctatum]|uniref:Beta/gamma crystallin 'Greek key' domain-containing protein n=1 Tax=Chiloscyllium punctatum TaxID=137246 RepID=A0A401SEM4_CHIPU|nr:hypothetical protein [Chiloscyllium punctatum]